MIKSAKDIQDLSAEELYALARQREKEEAKHQEKQLAKKREKLKEKRKALVAKQRKEVAALDREIRQLNGTAKVRASRTKRRAGGTSTIGDQLCAIIATQPQMAMSEIRERAEEAGIDTANLSQSLAYLKRQGRLTSPRRSIYAAP